jgi:hypothetical protein
MSDNLCEDRLGFVTERIIGGVVAMCGKLQKK